ncbi:hypothetical protein Tco_1574925, partial [Tanacetum coccineum]
FSGYGVLILVPLWSLVKCRHRYAVSSLMDTAYRMLEQLGFEIPAESLIPASGRRSKEDFEIGLDVVIQELYDHMEEIPARRIANIEEELRAREILALADERKMTRLRERVSMLEGSNMRLRGDLVEERERANSIGCRLSYVQEEWRQIRSSRYYDRMDFRRLETFAMRCLGYCP